MGAVTGRPEDALMRRIEELEARLKKIENPAVIASAQLLVTKPWLFYDSSDKLRMALGGTAPNEYFVIYDASGNEVFSDDALSGQGLARPYIPFTVFNTSELSAPAASTTSGSFVALKSIHGLKQHPRMRVDCVVITSGGTTGEVQLKHGYGGDVIAGPVSVAAGTNNWVGLTGNVQGDHMGRLSVDVEAKRTGGAGTVAVLVALVYGVQS